MKKYLSLECLLDWHGKLFTATNSLNLINDKY